MSGGSRPKPGDLLIFTFNEDEKNADGSVKYGEGWFAHISILRSIEPMEPDAERAARVVDLRGRRRDDRQGGLPRLPPGDRADRRAGQRDPRTMKGWIDIEKAVEAGLVPKR